VLPPDLVPTPRAPTDLVTVRGHLGARAFGALGAIGAVDLLLFQGTAKAGQASRVTVTSTGGSVMASGGGAPR
jgi:hypothetical protein